MLCANDGVLVLGPEEKAAFDAMSCILGKRRNFLGDFVLAVAQCSSKHRFAVGVVFAQQFAADGTARSK